MPPHDPIWIETADSTERTCSVCGSRQRREMDPAQDLFGSPRAGTWRYVYDDVMTYDEDHR
jgi:hypothetical protein